MANDVRLKYRVAGVALVENKILLYRTEGSDYWSLPGGLIDLGEPAQKALEREMIEEIGVEARAEDFLWAIENFYYKNEMPVHELALYFSMKIPSESPLYLNETPLLGKEGKRTLIFQWWPLYRLKELLLYPEVVLDLLNSSEKGCYRILGKL